MEYHEAANFLFDLRRYPSREGLDATRALCEQLGNPQDDLVCVQVAGSNGKGSTARMVERTLREAGFDVGLFTSPHLSDLRERVRIDGRKVTKAATVEYVEAVREHALAAAAEGDCPTFFEATTVLALWAFARAEVDVAVLEVGIGGRYDATSVVDPLASAVTSVTLEHTALLGDTVAEIARDKAQVAGRSPLVTAATDDALAAVRDEVAEVVTVGADGSEGDPPDVRATYEGREGLTGRVRLDGPDWSVDTRLSQLGAHQAENAGVAAVLVRQVADALDTPLPDHVLERGLAGAHWPGRFEVMERSPLTVLDGAHNPGSCETVAATLAEFDYDDLHLVVGAMSDKDHAGMADALPRADHVYTCRADVDRAESPEALARVFRAGDRAGAVHVGGNVSDALARAREAAGPDDAVLLTGSLYAVAEAREVWVRPEIPKRVTDLDEARAVLESADVTEAGVWRMRGKSVHRVVKTRVSPRQAQYLKEEMLSLGGECATSGLSTQDHEPVDVVLMGTLAQFKRLFGKLDDQPFGLRQVAERLRETLGIGVDPPQYPWESRTAVMGIINVTPDSFHDGGEYDALDEARARAEAMVDAGVDILDVGGESTRPGADPVPVDEEISRVVPLVEAVADLDTLVSVDTRKAAVARAALDAGADVINDVTGLDDPGMREVLAEYQPPTVVMHSIDAPVDPSVDVEYDDVVEDVVEQLRERVLLAEKAGLDRSRILVDPGLGFGKSKRENFELLSRLDEFHALGCPVLVGHSHKSMFSLVGEESGDAPSATVAASALAADRGADVVRVHDVPENVVAVRTAHALDPPWPPADSASETGPERSDDSSDE
ncbi:dihydropteroate synthase [Halomarina oriensis]|uniref:Probable bifunctional folylpolyglutamate synthase/dihydropteroate synthase n=1 Tax=Halomarina oriensis TaxID=671145 RepID=A0A6B0GMN7_9EURY|nr:dihydropteroate synthase [Halomarina oriensis]MWG35191.1 dihydropteroate synthase [Halomarina oriensis]